MYIETHIRGCYSVNYKQARDVTGKLPPEARSVEHQIVKCELHQNRGSPDRIRLYSYGSVLSGRSERQQHIYTACYVLLVSWVRLRGTRCFQSCLIIRTTCRRHACSSESYVYQTFRAYCFEIEGLQRTLTLSVRWMQSLPPVWSSGYWSRGPGFDSRPYQIFWQVAGLERGPLSLVRIIEELLERKIAAPV
jgi:hypothetical protein